MMSTVIVKIQPLLTYWSDPALAKLLRQDLKGWLDPRLSDKPVCAALDLSGSSAASGPRDRSVASEPGRGRNASTARRRFRTVRDLPTDLCRRGKGRAVATLRGGRSGANVSRLARRIHERAPGAHCGSARRQSGAIVLSPVPTLPVRNTPQRAQGRTRKTRLRP